MNCFGLCCVALPYAKSADFAFNKDSGTPCRNLQSDFLCGIHDELRSKGFRGCVAYECFGAGQNVSQNIYEGKDWVKHPELANEMFQVFPIVQQLHEMLWYIKEALEAQVAQAIHDELQIAFERTEQLTKKAPAEILEIDVPGHRAYVNALLLKVSELLRPKPTNAKLAKRRDFLGAKLQGANLRGVSLRGALLIAADLRGADLRQTDVIGADFRDADLCGADLRGSIFLTQAQVNAAKGDTATKLPHTVQVPAHWKK
ncbi:pentapeptide repeat-containing protein [Ectobacillus sp. JY-23]|uniref:pentapeptide repeat-containing protein n=1 Tax=Ectobacillus sp. JY-23 TaxID=2933872 RepID=UPI001FF5A53F|nr:pentapeptide repeat-containing protein [Ectobacillus sp. JY-23]UOY94594.1 pentapeptide repeat-containing protein [Ectobacillus sp. JY-23]